MVTCTGCAFSATCAANELGETSVTTGIGYRTANWNGVESTEFGFCTVIGMNPAIVTSLGSTVPTTWF